MIYKSYKFKNKDGVELKVRFYFTGIYTIVDKNGEHESGTWSKRPLLVGIHLKPSKDKSCVLYTATPFNATKGYDDYKLSDVARYIANHAVFYEHIAV